MLCFQPADYYLRDVQFYCGVRNVDAPNYGDSDYSKVDDIGPILSETRINYKGVKRYVKSGSYEKLTMYMLDALFDGISDMSDVGSSLALLYKGSKEFAEWADILKECIPSQALKVYSKDNETNIRDFKSRAVQKNNDKPYYERFATVASNDDYRDLLIDDYMQMIMKLDNSSPKSKIFIEVRYNLFGHDKSGNDFIVLTQPSGAYTEKYKTSHSNSAQFMRHYEDTLFAE